MASAQTNRISGSKTLWRWLSYGTAIILLLIPLHEVTTIWLGATYGHLNIFRIWKETLLLVMFVAVLIAAWRQIGKVLKADWLFRLILAYGALVLICGSIAYAAGAVTLPALEQGLIIDLRFILFFSVAWLIVQHSDWLYRHWRPLVIWPAVAVVVFGLLQCFVLPADFLTHFGYGPHTIKAFSTVDNNPQLVRIQSTLRGPNPLGAYLVVIITTLVGVLTLRRHSRWYHAVLLITSLPVLFYSYSRSAWIGVVLSCALLAWLVAHRTVRRWLLVGGMAFIVLCSTGFVLFGNSPHVQDAVLHTSTASRSQVSSDEQRLSSLQSGVNYVVHHPFGTGTGTAGPASVRNGDALIAENYYLQLGQEVGVVGLVLFVAINGIIGWRLWQQRQTTLSLVLLCSLLGVSVINLMSHAWADDTLGYVWWGLAGIALGYGAQRPQSEQPGISVAVPREAQRVVRTARKKAAKV